MESKGFNPIDTITWVKTSNSGKLLTSSTRSFGNAKEEALVFMRGKLSKGYRSVYFGKNVIVSPRRKQSQKPEYIYEMLEQNTLGLSPFIEIFGRDNNIRRNWITIGNQVSSTHPIFREKSAGKDFRWEGKSPLEKSLPKANPKVFEKQIKNKTKDYSKTNRNEKEKTNKK